MVHSCSAYNCTQRFQPGISFHKFPKDETLLKSWLVALSRDNWVPSKTSKVCGRHFTDDCYEKSPWSSQKRLKSDAVPSIFNFPEQLQKQNKSRYPLQKRSDEDSKKCQTIEINTVSEKSSSDDNCHEEFLQELNSWTEGINLKFPTPYHMRYRYSVPTSEVLYNICNMLATVPKLYTQVLHLMDKMNLPRPYESDFTIENNDVFDSFLFFIYERVKPKLQLNDSNSEVESELESDDKRKDEQSVTVTSKRKIVCQKKPVKRSRIIKPSTLKTTSKVSINVKDVTQNKIELNVPEKIEVEQHRSAEETEKSSLFESTEFGILYSVDKEREQGKDIKNKDNDNNDCISAENLASNKISFRDRDMLPVYKHYQPGNPSCKLYIKNLSRRVTRDDLLYIYKRYFIQGIDEQRTMFDIHLMREGRMKNQAFVTLQNVKQAQLALDETNGYVLKNKPMVVQFAQSVFVKI